MRETLWLAAYGLAWLAIGALLGFVRGWTMGCERQREIDHMEPPVVGALHFNDGWIHTVYASDAAQAAELVIARATRAR